MKIIYNKFIPFKGFYAISFFGLLFVRDEKGEKKPVYGMKPYVMGCVYDAAFAKKIINLFDNRGFKFIDLITQQRFTASLGKIRKGK